MHITIMVRAALVLGLWTSADLWAAPRFDSSYTRLAAACVELPQPPEYEGQDPASDCPGPDGYRLRLYHSAADTHLVVVRPISGESGEVLDSLIEGVSGIDPQRAVVEWRLADGVPFAIIARSRPPIFDDEGMAQPGPLTTLEVRGIGARIALVESVDVAQTADANTVARKQADAGWASR